MARCADWGGGVSTVRIPANTVRSVEPAFHSARRCVDVEVDMNEAQMLSALKSMLQHVPGETWAAWVAQINGEVTP